LMVVIKTGMIDFKEMQKRIRVLSVPIGDGGIPDFSNFGDDDKKKPTFN